MIEEKIMRTIRNLITGRQEDSRRAEGLWEVTSVLVEKKWFFSSGQVTFTAKFRVNEASKEVIYNEALIERIMGLEAKFGRGFSRFGLRKLKTGAEPGGLGKIFSDHSDLIEKRQGYTFRFRQIRQAVKKAVEEEGYTFRHQLWGSM
ncbi:MAG: hypothetical protein ACOYJV_08115 [Aminivibrio sp.]|jgi:hypothetical protein